MLTGEDSEGEVININKIDTALKTVGISLKDFLTGAKGIDDIFLELASKWDTLDLANMPNMGAYRVESVIERLCGLEFLEPSGKTSGLSYILHISKRKDIDDKIDYVKSKKQEKARQKEAILRYLDSIPTINNTEARQLLSLPEKDRSKVSRLFAELISENEIVQTKESTVNNVKYKRLKE